MCGHLREFFLRLLFLWYFSPPFPPGYVLKKDKKKQEEEENKITLEELIETERQALDQSKVTRITLETFMAWKKKKVKILFFFKGGRRKMFG